RAPLDVARVGQRAIPGEQPFGLGRLAALDRREQLLHAGGALGERPTIQVSPQRAPAREAVLARDRALGLGHGGRRPPAAQLYEAVLGQLLQELQVGTIGERHDAPSFHVPVSAVSGGRWWCRLPDRRWVRPFTRTVSRLDGSSRECTARSRQVK